MLERIFGGTTMVATATALDAASLRHQVIANNLANANTPGFKRQEVVFEDELARALSGPRDHIGNLTTPLEKVHPSVRTVGNTSLRVDGNNVNMELENVNLAVNQLRFEFLTQSMAGQFSSLKNVINGGR